MTGERAEMPFLEHLGELRTRLLWSVAAVGVLSVVGFFAVTELNLIGWLEMPIRDLLPDERLFFTNPTTPVMVTFKLSFVVGIVLAFPVLAYHAWEFLSPALHEHEKKYVVPGVWVAFLLFLAGLAMAYFVVLPLGLRFLLTFQAGTLEPIITIDEYLRFATRLILAFGIIFEMPVILVLLSLMGVVTSDGLKQYRQHALVGMAVVAAFLTPADPGTMLLLLLPMAVLYEGSIWAVHFLGRGREPAGGEAAEAGP
jgi:sec-independent protein translocase protein TatC